MGIQTMLCAANLYQGHRSIPTSSKERNNSAKVLRLCVATEFLRSLAPQFAWKDLTNM